MKNHLFQSAALAVSLLLLGIAMSAPATVAPHAPEPAAVESVTGPIPPFTPGGPTVEIVLKNVSDKPMESLTATLSMQATRSAPPPGRDYIFKFEVTADNPLAPGKSSTARMKLIGAGINSDAPYPLKISGSFKNKESFSHTVQVKISEPSGKTGS
jgi:hypothetical protein